jgi:hypothetical protein
MTHEPPARDGPPASGAAARLASLLAEFERVQTGGEAAEAPQRPADVGARERPESFGNGRARSTLQARLAELAPVEAPAARPEPEPVVEPATAAAQIEPARPAEPPLPYAAPETEAGPPPSPPPPPTWRSRILPIAMVVLIVAIPVLGVIGAKTVLNSRAGKVSERSLDPRAPGYIAIVEPTPTALVVQHDANDVPVSLTMLALGTGDTGGSVLFVPLDTNVVKPALLVDRLRTAFVRGGEPTLVNATARLLGVGFDKVIDLGDTDWAALVGPVSPLTIQNPVELTLGATVLPIGPIELPADQVGAYLAANAPDQDDLDRLARQQLVWRAWLQAIAEAGPTTVPATTNGLGPFVSALAGGQTSMATLAVVPSATPSPDGGPAFDPQVDQILEQVTDAVPSPVSPGLGGRFATRVLNGFDGDPIPDELLRELVKAGAQIDALGNATRFGRRTTTIEYRSARFKSTAESVRKLLGGGKIQFNAETNDPVDLVIVLGRDALRDFSG